MALWLTAIGAVLCGWATLAILGDEHQRRLNRLERELQVAREQASDASRKPAPPPVAKTAKARAGPGAKQAQR